MGKLDRNEKTPRLFLFLNSWTSSDTLTTHIVVHRWDKTILQWWKLTTGNKKQCHAVSVTSSLPGDSVLCAILIRVDGWAPAKYRTISFVLTRALSDQVVPTQKLVGTHRNLAPPANNWKKTHPLRRVSLKQKKKKLIGLADFYWPGKKT